MQKLKEDSPLWEVFGGQVPVMDMGPVYILDWREVTEVQMLAIAAQFQALYPDDLELQAKSQKEVSEELKRGNIKLKMEHFE